MYTKTVFLGWHTMHVGISSRLRQQTSGHHRRTSDRWLGRLLVQQALHMRLSLHTIAITSDSLTLRTNSDISIAICNHRLPRFPTRGNTRLDTHTHSVTSYDNECRIRLQHDPVLVFSALYANFWGFLASCFWTDLRLYSPSASCKHW